MSIFVASPSQADAAFKGQRPVAERHDQGVILPFGIFGTAIARTCLPPQGRFGSTLAPVSAERRKQVEECYHAVMERPEAERAAFLAQACADDPELRGEVQSLLDHQADSFPESAPVLAIKTPSPGAKLGNFEIVELIGRGGMGEVYRARDSQRWSGIRLRLFWISFPVCTRRSFMNRRAIRSTSMFTRRTPGRVRAFIREIERLLIAMTLTESLDELLTRRTHE